MDLVPSGSFIPDVIKSLLAPFDPLLPVFQVNGNNLMSTYDVRIPAGKTVASVIEELADNMLCTCSYDPSGRLRFRPSDLPETSLRPSPESTVSFTSAVDYSSSSQLYSIYESSLDIAKE